VEKAKRIFGLYCIVGLRAAVNRRRYISAIVVKSRRVYIIDIVDAKLFVV